METIENKETGRLFKYEYIPCHGLYNVTVHTKEDPNRPIGRCTVVQPLEDIPPIILDFVIYAQPHRKKGFGTDLMGFIKYLFANGIKSWFYSSEGKEFARKTGWKEVKTPKGNYLFYSKENDNESSTVREIPTIDKGKILEFKKEEKKEKDVQKLPINNRKKRKKEVK